jgi:tRNA-specific 2-thiouridylase
LYTSEGMVLCVNLSCEADKQLNVAVLLSGGVDSSLALSLLVAAGHKVTAFYLQIWFQEDFRNYWDSCPWEQDLQYAQKVNHQPNALTYD